MKTSIPSPDGITRQWHLIDAEEAVLGRQALRAADGSARRLARSQRKLAADFPLSPAAVRALPLEVEDDLDAFLKRDGQLVNAMQDELFYESVPDLLATYEAVRGYLEHRLPAV